MPPLQPTLIAINPVLADRADDFEDWLGTIASRRRKNTVAAVLLLGRIWRCLLGELDRDDFALAGLSSEFRTPS